MKQIFLFFLTKFVSICLTNFLINVKLLLKLPEVRVHFLNIGKLHKNLCRHILKEIFERLKPARLKNSSLSLEFLSTYPCFPLYVYDLSVSFFEKFFIFFNQRFSDFWFLPIFYLLVQL